MTAPFFYDMIGDFRERIHLGEDIQLVQQAGAGLDIKYIPAKRTNEE